MRQDGWPIDRPGHRHAAVGDPLLDRDFMRRGWRRRGSGDRRVELAAVGSDEPVALERDDAEPEQGQPRAGAARFAAWVRSPRTHSDARPPILGVRVRAGPRLGAGRSRSACRAGTLYYRRDHPPGS
jgi:hypothetical protein